VYSGMGTSYYEPHGTLVTVKTATGEDLHFFFFLPSFLPSLQDFIVINILCFLIGNNESNAGLGTGGGFFFNKYFVSLLWNLISLAGFFALVFSLFPGAIVGIVVGVLGLMLLAGIVVAMFLVRQNRKTKQLQKIMDHELVRNSS